jgi:hypothetical protein
MQLSMLSLPRFAVGLSLLVAAGCAEPTTTGGVSPPELPPEPSGPPELLPGLYTGFDPSGAPHYRHIRTQMSDFRITYLSDAAARRAEYEWSARHFDRILLDWPDSRSPAEYKRITPTVELYRYVVTWTVPLPDGSSDHPTTQYYAHMQQWYARHPEYQIENAFLHDPAKCSAATRTQACRIVFHRYHTNTNRWVVNPADAGLRAYNRDRLTAVASDVDGLFIDEHSTGDFTLHLQPLPILEYPTWPAFEADIVRMLRNIRTDISPKRLMVNGYNYVKQWDLDMSVAAGGTHMESMNNPVFPEMESRWSHVERLLAAGSTVNMARWDHDMPESFHPGNSVSTEARRRIWELASHYLVAPVQPGQLYFNSIGDDWSKPYSANWDTAIEADIGRPLEARRLIADKYDASGRQYRIWARDYERALVIVRPVISWEDERYGDDTAIEVPLPAGHRFRPLMMDGRVAGAINRIRLRAAEAAILIKEDRVK